MVLLDWERMRGDDGFEPLSSVASAAGRPSLRSLYSCECLLKWRSAPARAQVSWTLASGPKTGEQLAGLCCLHWAWVLSLLLSLSQAPPLLGTPASGSLPCPGLTPD